MSVYPNNAHNVLNKTIHLNYIQKKNKESINSIIINLQINKSMIMLKQEQASIYYVKNVNRIQDRLTLKNKHN